MKKSKEKNKTSTSWGGVAAWYDELLHGEGTYQKEVILPHLLRLLAPVSGKRIVDIACGQGFFSFALMEVGAKVTGFDIAPELIARASAMGKEKYGDQAKFHVARADNLPAKAGEYDAAIIILALQNIKEFAETALEATRVLKSEGEFIVVLNHPAFRIPGGASAWAYDEQKGIQYRRIERYALPFSSAIDMNPGEKDEQKKKITVSFHRSLQDYIKVFTKAGLVMTGLEEWHSHKKSEKGPRAKAEDQARKEFPLFLMLQMRKI